LQTSPELFQIYLGNTSRMGESEMSQHATMYSDMYSKPESSEQPHCFVFNSR